MRACGLSEDCHHLLAVLGNGFIFRCGCPARCWVGWADTVAYRASAALCRAAVSLVLLPWQMPVSSVYSTCCLAAQTNWLASALYCPPLGRFEYHGPLAAPQQSSEGDGSEEEGKENAVSQ